MTHVYDHKSKDDIEFELFKRRTRSNSRVPPRILDLDALTVQDSEQIDPGRFRTSDLVHTLLYYSKGIEGVASLQNISQEASVSFSHFRANTDNDYGVTWEISRRGNRGAINIIDTTSPDTDLSELDPTMFVAFGVTSNGVWKTLECGGVWSSATARDSRMMRTVSLLVRRYVLEEIALILLGRRRLLEPSHTDQTIAGGAMRME
ncbi:hypothetical protein LTR05_002909 [Lithohypha guttulata]|uniref:Uncharacterized protein n=1 Tax=Lithohypha guttulata TaxID=1690604 RepID=A0AAN7T4W6_9EURO|nr:hypothetical protein LTR05_002909 [Lithohypha guttulata]